MVISLNVMEMGPKGTRKELILLDQNFNATLIKSMSSVVFTAVRWMNRSIDNVVQSPLKCEDNLVKHATILLKALAMISSGLP